MKNYAEQYSSPKWQKLRLEVMDRDEFTCRSCGATDKTLNVHHAYYIKGKDVWDYADDMLVTWCASCHDKMKGKFSA